LTHFSPPHKADDAHHDVDGDGDDDDAGDDEDVDSTASSLSQLQWSTPQNEKVSKGCRNSRLDLLYPPPSFKKSFSKVENTHTQFSR